VRQEPILPDEFVPVGQAARLYRLRLRDRLQVCRYPEEGTWRQFEGVKLVLESMEQAIAKSNVSVFVGLPGTTKTFHMLLLGHKWEAEPQPQYLWIPFARQRERRAFYGVASALDLEKVHEQWDALRDPALCLWLVDDLHDDITKCVELAGLFSLLKLDQTGHKLVFAGWSQPKALRGSAARITLTAKAIELGLRALDLELADESVLERFAGRPSVGIKEIMWLARNAPSALEETSFTRVHILFAQNRIGSLDPEVRRLAEKLSRLRYLGVALPIDADPELWVRLQRLENIGLVIEGPKGWELADDEQARALLCAELSEAMPSLEVLLSRFLSPLQALVLEHMSERLSTLVTPLLSSLQNRTCEELCTWLNLEVRGTREPLLTSFLADDSLKVFLESVAIRADLPLREVGRFLASVRQQAWAQATASKIIATRGEEITAAILSGEVDAWRTGEVLANLTGATMLRDNLRAVLRRPEFQAHLKSLSPIERGQALAQIRRFDRIEASYVERALLPPDGHSMAKELVGKGHSAIWRALDDTASVDVELAASSLEALDNVRVFEAIISKPTLARRFLASFHPKYVPQQRLRVLDKFRQALAQQRAIEEAVSFWTSPYDLVSLIDLVRRTRQLWLLETESIKATAKQLLSMEKAAVLTELCKKVSKCGPSSLRDDLASELEQLIGRGKEPLNARIHALTILSRPRACKVLRSMLEETAGGSSLAYEERAFWYLWNACVALPEEEQVHVSQIAEHVLSEAQEAFDVAPSLAKLSLSGLAAFLSDRLPLLPSSLPSPLEAFPEQASSPVMTVCQFYALSKGIPCEHAGEYLRALSGVIADPPPDFQQHWRSSTSRARRVMMAMLFDGLLKLYQDPITQQLAINMATAMASKKADDLWDKDDCHLRFRIARSFSETKCVAELLMRQAPKWASQVSYLLRKRHPPEAAMVMFLWSVSATAKDEPSIGIYSRCLLATANAVAESSPFLTECTRVALVVIERCAEGAVPFGRRQLPFSTLDGFYIPNPLIRVLYSVGIGLPVEEKDMSMLRLWLPQRDYQVLKDMVAQLAL
jgi:hypothetical protein